MNFSVPQGAIDVNQTRAAARPDGAIGGRLSSMGSLAKRISLILACAAFAAAAEPTRVLIVVGPSNHRPGTHEVAAGGRLMAHALEHMANVADVEADVVYEWPDKALRDAASTVVFIGDTFPPNRLPNVQRNLTELGEMMDRGCGIACVHYATGLRGEDVTAQGDHPLLRWMGGYFANRTCPHHESIARVYEAATIEPAAGSHPVLRGWNAFTLHDEPYINNYFGPDGNRLAPNVTALAASMLPPESPKRETVAWLWSARMAAAASASSCRTSTRIGGSTICAASSSTASSGRPKSRCPPAASKRRRRS